MIMMFVSFENKADATKVANYLIDEHLAACISLVPVSSFYRWKGEKVNYEEIEGIIKTKEENYDKVKKAIESLLPYEIPQIIQVAVKDANKKYLDWVESEVK